MGLLLIKCSLVLLLSVSLTVSANSGEHFPFVGKINGQDINIRSGANINFERIDQMALNALVVVVAHHYEWYKIQLSENAHVYVRADYLKPITENTAQITADQVNVRARPNSESTIVGQLNKDVVVNFRSIKDNWVDIVPPVVVTGWVHDKFIVEEKDVKLEEMLPSVELNPILVDIKKYKDELLTVEGMIRDGAISSSSSRTYQLMIDDMPSYHLQLTPDLRKFMAHKVKVVGVVTKSLNPAEMSTIRVATISLIL